jgi:signal transduction histidine kinase
MRERVSALGGTFEAGREAGRFVVRATLPFQFGADA